MRYQSQSGGSSFWSMLGKRRKPILLLLALFCLFFVFNVFISHRKLPFSFINDNNHSHSDTDRNNDGNEHNGHGNNDQQPQPQQQDQSSQSSTTTSSTTATIASIKNDAYHPIYQQLVNRLESGYHPSLFHVAIVATDRPQYLRKTLESLSTVLYWNKDRTTVYQYGDNEQVNAIIAEFGLRQVKNPRVQSIDGRVIGEGAEHIAYHYAFIMRHMFQSVPSHQMKHFVIVEDDMLFAADFLLYFSQLAPVMDHDDTIYAISAFNDNGLLGKVSLDNMVYRTDFFIGLGWLVSRRHWEQEWSKTWPRTHWDHYLRSPQVRRNRQTLYPEVSRVYHSGYQGTHSTVAMYEQYFRDTVVNSHGFAPLGIAAADAATETNADTGTGDAATASSKYVMRVDRQGAHSLQYLYAQEYESFFKSLLDPKNPDTIYLDQPAKALEYTGKNLVMLVKSDINYHRPWLTISAYYGVWHTIPIRGAYRQAPMFKFNGNLIIILFPYCEHYADHKGNGPLLEYRAFLGGPLPMPHSESIVHVEVANQGVSCSNTCRDKYGDSARCDIHKISQLNNCDSLKKYFNCESCQGDSPGSDQPAYVPSKQQCLFNVGSNRLRTTCEAQHPDTQRLCACFDPARVDVFHKEWEAIISNARKQATDPSLET